MFGDVGSLTFDELHAIVGATRGEALRAAGDGWARAADLLDRQADALAAGLRALERAWESAAGHAHADRVRALVARMRATADVARYNNAQMLAAADATDNAVRHLALVLDSESPERDAAARDVADALNETYANVAARLTEPRLEVGRDHFSVRDGFGSEPVSDVVTALQAAGVRSNDARAGGMSQACGFAAANPVAVPEEPDTRARESVADGLSDGAGAAGDNDHLKIDLDADPPEGAAFTPAPARRAMRSSDQARFPVTPRSAVAPVLPAASHATPCSPAAAPGAPSPAVQPVDTGRKVSDDTYFDERGHQVRIRWGSAERGGHRHLTAPTDEPDAPRVAAFDRPPPEPGR